MPAYAACLHLACQRGHKDQRKPQPQALKAVWGHAARWHDAFSQSSFASSSQRAAPKESIGHRSFLSSPRRGSPSGSTILSPLHPLTSIHLRDHFRKRPKQQVNSRLAPKLQDVPDLLQTQDLPKALEDDPVQQITPRLASNTKRRRTFLHRRTKRAVQRRLALDRLETQN